MAKALPSRSSRWSFSEQARHHEASRLCEVGASQRLGGMAVAKGNGFQNIVVLVPDVM